MTIPTTVGSAERTESSSASAPIDPEALAPVLDPDGSGCMLPAAAYLDDAVLAWERTHLFAGAWVCAGRAADLADVGARRAVNVGDDAVLLVRGDDGVLRGFFNVCQHRAHELAPCGATSEAPLDPLPVPRLALRARRHAAVDAPVRRARTGSTSREHGLVPVAVEEWHGWVMVNASGDAPPRRRVPRRHRGPRRRLRARAPGRRRHARYELATNWKLDRRELPGVLPLPEHPPRAVPRSARRRAARTTTATAGCGSAAGRT